MVAATTLSGAEFRRRFRWLVFHTWNIPPVFGLGFILLIGVLTPEQLLGILITPLEPAYILGWLAFAMWFLPRSMRPLADWLDGKPGGNPQAAVRAVQRFPLVYWTTFLVYLAIAPASVIVAAELYSGFVATPYDWFRIELVALIVSIIVGLPIFFLIFDLFGRALGGLELRRAILTVRTKVFLIGALVPLLIDTMLVQYYWTRTGYFTFETFGVWLLLELLAIGGSLIFAHSFGQSLSPLQSLIGAPHPLPESRLAALNARSTDELGLLTAGYRALLHELQLRNEILALNNRLLRSAGGDAGAAEVFTAVVESCRQAIGADQSFLIVHDPHTNTLVGVTQTGAAYRPEGYYRLALDEQSLAVFAYVQGRTAVAEDAAQDPRVSAQLCAHFGIRSAMATPLRLGDEMLGVLMVAHTATRRAYDDRDRALIEGLAREAALALQTQRLRLARERAEAERLEQAELVHTLMDATEEGIYGADLNGLCTFINRAALKMLGYRQPAELLGRNLHELIHHTYPDGRPYPKEQCRVRLAMLAGDTAHADDELHWRADGSSFPVEYWSHPIVRDGRAVGTVVSFVDISQRQQAGQALRESEARLRNVLAVTGEGIWDWDVPMGVVRHNKRWCELFGVGEEFVEHPVAGFAERLHEDDRAMVLARLEACLQGGGPYRSEHRMRRADGQIIWVQDRGDVVERDAQGRVQRVVGSVADISDRRRAEEETRVFQNLANVSGQGIGMARLDATISYLNPALRRMLGLGADEDVGKYSFYDFYAEADRAFLEARVIPAVGAHGSWTGELPLRSAQGASIPTIHNVFLLHDAAGKPVAFANVLTDISEQRQAARALAESEARFRSIIEASPVPFALNDDHQNITYLNPAFVQTFGYTRDDIPTLTDWWPRAYPDAAYRSRVATEWAARLERARREGSAFEPMELDIRDKSGAPRSVMASAASLGQAFAGTHLVILYDITARKQAELALRASKERLRTILETEPECVKVLAADGALLEMNPAGLAMLEADSLDQVKDRKLSAFVAKSQRAAFIELGRRVIEKGESGRLEFEIVGFRGTHRWLETNAVPLRDPATGETKLLGVTRDITARKQAEAELRRHREQLEELVAARTAEVREQARIIDQIHDSVVTTDMAGVVTGWNKGAERLFGYGAAEAMGRFIGFVYPPQEQEFLREQVIAPLQACGVQELEVRMQRKNGECFTAHLSLSLLYDDTGRPRGMAAYSLDITARKRAEALADQRASELEAANRELEAFSYSVSHDLRAPLRAIDGFSRILFEDYAARLDAEALEHLNRVRNAVQRMGVLIDELLELSRVGRAALHRTAVDLSQLAAEVVAQLRHGEPARVVEVEIAPGIAAQGDARLLRLVLENLLGNAWKYTGRTAAPRIALTVSAGSDAPVYCVRDNGAGFDMRYVDKLFRPFQRLHTPREFPGNGIGLATVARIIHRHGGRVWAEGEVGKGAMFCFTLPP